MSEDERDAKFFKQYARDYRDAHGLQGACSLVDRLDCCDDTASLDDITNTALAEWEPNDALMVLLYYGRNLPEDKCHAACRIVAKRRPLARWALRRPLGLSDACKAVLRGESE